MNMFRSHLRGLATRGRDLATFGRGLATRGWDLATLGRDRATLGLHAFRAQSRRGTVGTGRPPNPVRSTKHVGATERFGAELRAMRHMQVSPELVSDIETELQWGLIWHEFERSMQAEIDRVFAPYLAMTECEDFDDLRDLVGLAGVDAVLVPA